MYHNDSITNIVKSLVRRRYREINFRNESTPLLHMKNDYINKWNLRVQEEEGSISQGSSLSWHQNDGESIKST